MAVGDDRQPACVLKPVRVKTKDGTINQTDFVNVPKQLENHIFISKTKACFIGRRPSSTKVQSDFKVCLPEAWQSVSALHAIVRWKDGKVTVEDRSSNGTWVGKPGKGIGKSEEDYTRLEKDRQEEVAMNSFIMLAQWPSGRKAEDVLIYQLIPVPSEASRVSESRPLPFSDTAAHPGASADASGPHGSFSTVGGTKSAPSSAKALGPCTNCKEHSQKALRYQSMHTEEQSRHEKTKIEKSKADKEVISLRKEVESARKAAADAKKVAQGEKKKVEEAAQAKKAEVDAELVDAKKQIKEVTASRDRLREGIAPLLSALKELRDANKQNRTDVADMESTFTADVQSLDEVMKTHTLSRGNEALLKEHEQEITAMQKDQRRVEREAAAWRLKAEAYATKLPDELNRVINSHLPNLVEECIEKVHSRVVALNSATASQLLGPEPSAGLAITQGGEGAEERALGLDHSQRTVVSSHLGADGTPDLPTPMACDGDAVPQTAGPDTQLRGSQGASGASVSFRDIVNGSQVASPGGPTVAGPSEEVLGLQRTDGGANGGLKRPHLSAEAGEQGDGKRRRAGSAGGGANGTDNSPENHSQQVNVAPNRVGSNENMGNADGEKSAANGGEKARSQHDEPEYGSQANKSDARDGTWTGGESNGRSADLMKKLAALPKSHEGMDF